MTDLGEKTTLCCLEMWNCLKSSKINSFVAFSLSPGFLIQVFLVFKTGAKIVTCFTYGWLAELITWGQYRPFELVRDTEGLNGMELTIHANPNYSTCGVFVANPLQWCGIAKGGSWLELSEELVCCAGNLYSGNIQCKMFCPEQIGKWFLKACDILQQVLLPEDLKGSSPRGFYCPLLFCTLLPDFTPS